MSVKAVATEEEILRRRILRFTIGMTLAVGITAIFNWPLAYVAPVFLAKFLVDRQAPTVQTVYELIISMMVTVAIAWFTTVGLTQYPSLLMPLIAVLMVWSYYLFTDPKWNFFATIMLMACLLVPYMAIIDPGAGMYVGMGLSGAGIVAVVLFALLHIFYPDLAPERDQHGEAQQSKSERLFESCKALLLSFPVICYFYAFEVSGAILTMIFIALLSLQTAGKKSVKISMFMLLTNIIGGIIAILIYNVVTFVPVIGFYLAIIFLVSLIFSQKMYSMPDKAPIFSTIYSTLLVLVSSTMASTGKDVDTNFYLRIVQIGIACIYLVIISYFIDSRDWKFLKRASAND